MASPLSESQLSAEAIVFMCFCILDKVILRFHKAQQEIIDLSIDSYFGLDLSAIVEIILCQYFSRIQHTHGFTPKKNMGRFI